MTRILAVVALASAVSLAMLTAAVAPSPAAAGSLSLRISPDSVSPLEKVTISGRVSPKLKKAARLTLQSSFDGTTFITLKRLSLARGATTYKTTWVAGATLGPLYVRARFGTLTTRKLMITVAERAHVEIASHAFSPQTLTVKPWTSVVWTNRDVSPHTVTAVDSLAGGATPTGLFDSGPLANGAGFTYTFATPGTYFYECTIHSLEPAMHAQVIVQ
jgi:plastocyanin